MEYERIWHGIRFTFDAYYEFGDGVDQSIQIDITSREVIDMNEASCWQHYIPVSKEDWLQVEDEFIAHIAEQMEQDNETDRQERRMERRLSEWESYGY